MNLAVPRVYYFDNSVRAFFPMAALIAILVPAYTVCVLVNKYSFPLTLLNIYQWHAYEMLFGFTYTLVIGFILTAGGYWTGNGPLKGLPLISLWLLWIIEHISLMVIQTPLLLITINSLLPIAFTYFLIQILNGYVMKGLFILLISMIPVARILYLLGITNIIDLNTNQIYEFVAWVLIMLTSIIAGRITPRFTRNYFKIKEPIQEPKAILATAFILTFLMVFNTLEQVPSIVKTTLSISAGLIHLARMRYWHTFQAFKKPIIGFLHIGFILLAISIIFKGLSFTYPRLDMYRGSLHLIVMGAISFIAMNIMIRASLGHTGRKIEMKPIYHIIFACLFIGFFLRAIIPIIFPNILIPSLHYSMGFWTLGFLIYFLKFFPILLTKRIDAT